MTGAVIAKAYVGALNRWILRRAKETHAQMDAAAG